ncbi:Hypothetical protein Cp106_0647 [Corynebacterium pseudotuberculosis 1/06-A]|nr:Hypothetical protein Cp106_0647 [Corynebacterium pseudotuberculosis 1/06-A]
MPTGLDVLGQALCEQILFTGKSIRFS